MHNHFSAKASTKTYGFSLIELLVAIAVIGILAGVVYSNFGGANAAGRDAKRASDLRNLQIAIEQYKQRHGRYPEQGCGVPASTFATEANCSEYIRGLVPEFLPRLPIDPRRGSQPGFSYLTNDEGTVYKLMVQGTVEQIVTPTHPLASCDMALIDRPSDLRCAGGDPPPPTCERHMCAPVIFSGNTDLAHCDPNNERFRSTYAVWGGFAERTTPSNVFTASNSALDLTQRVICR